MPRCTADSRKKSPTGVEKHPWMKDVVFFPLPSAKKYPILRRKWLQKIRRGTKWSPSKYTRICSQHFVDGKPTEENPLPTLFYYNQRERAILRPQNKLQVQRQKDFSSDSRSVILIQPDIVELETLNIADAITLDDEQLFGDSVISVESDGSFDKCRPEILDGE